MGLRLLVAVLLGWLAIAGFRRMRERRVEGSEWEVKGKDDEIDRAELEAAEQEVKDMDTDAKGRPLDHGIGDDWGPGTPKPPYV